MFRVLSKKDFMMAASVAFVGVPLTWYGYKLFRGKSPREIHEQSLRDAKETKNLMKDNVNEIKGTAQNLKDQGTTKVKQNFDVANKTIDHEAKPAKSAAKDSGWFGWMWGNDEKSDDNEQAVRRSIQDISENVPKKVEKEVDWIKKTTRESAEGGREATKATVKDNTRAAQDLGQEIADKTGQKVEEGKNVAHDTKDTVHHYGQDLADKASQKVEQGKEAAKHAWGDVKHLVQDQTHHAANKAGQKVEEGKDAARNAVHDTKHAVQQRGQDLADKAGQKVEEGKNAVHDTKHAVQQRGQDLVDKAGQKVEEGKHAVHDTKHAVQQRGQELADKTGQKVEKGKATAKDVYYDAKDSAQEQGSEMVDKAKEVKNETGWFGSSKKDDR